MDKSKFIGPILFVGLIMSLGGSCELALRFSHARTDAERSAVIGDTKEFSDAQKFVLKGLLETKGDSTQEALSKFFRETGKKLWKQREGEEDENRWRLLGVASGEFFEASKLIREPGNDEEVTTKVAMALRHLGQADKAIEESRVAPNKNDSVVTASSTSSNAAWNSAGFWAALTTTSGIVILFLTAMTTWFNFRRAKIELAKTTAPSTRLVLPSPPRTLPFGADEIIRSS